MSAENFSAPDIPPNSPAGDKCQDFWLTTEALGNQYGGLDCFTPTIGEPYTCAYTSASGHCNMVQKATGLKPDGSGLYSFDRTGTCLGASDLLKTHTQEATARLLNAMFQNDIPPDIRAKYHIDE